MNLPEGTINEAAGLHYIGEFSSRPSSQNEIGSNGEPLKKKDDALKRAESSQEQKPQGIHVAGASSSLASGEKYKNAFNIGYYMPDSHRLSEQKNKQILL